MRLESSVLSVSWIPSQAISGLPRLPFDLGITHYDDPPPDEVIDPEPLLRADRVRFVNRLQAWVEVDGNDIVDAGYAGRGFISVSNVRLAGRHLTFASLALPDLQRPPQHRDGAVTFVQSAGGRTGMPAPRKVNRKPFLQITAPTAWTTLTLTIDQHGQGQGGITGASPFPRHWIYDHAGKLRSKTGCIDFHSWYHDIVGSSNTPWGDTDSPAFATEIETALERRLSTQIMRGGKRPPTLRLSPGQTLVEQGRSGNAVFLLLDGILDVEVDGARIAEVGPGAILGERALLEQGVRTATLRAASPCRVAVANTDELDPRALGEISPTHRREEQLHSE